MSWKANWTQSRRRFLRWWNREGLLVGMWGAPRAARPHEVIAEPATPATWEERYCDPEYRAESNRYGLSLGAYPADILPVASTELGPGSLALFCGSEPGFTAHTVWFHSCWEDIADPTSLPPLRFDPTQRWWRVTEAMIARCVARAQHDYLVGCPDLIENVDVLSSLRGAQTLLVDMVERPAWVEQKIWEINEVWCEAYQRIYDLIHQRDGGAAFGAFRVWGPGRTAKVQCDASAMFSPAMFARFVTPALTAQCEWLDHSLYHLDGTQAVPHLDALLGIEPLDAIEWTPQAGIEGGGHPRWYPLYRRILAAGKAVQVVDVLPSEVPPLLDAIGREGVYLLVRFEREDEVAALLEKIGADA